MTASRNDAVFSFMKTKGLLKKPHKNNRDGSRKDNRLYYFVISSQKQEKTQKKHITKRPTPKVHFDLGFIIMGSGRSCSFCRSELFIVKLIKVKTDGNQRKLQNYRF